MIFFLWFCYIKHDKTFVMLAGTVVTTTLFGWGRGEHDSRGFRGGGKKALRPTPGPYFFTWQDCFYFGCQVANQKWSPSRLLIIHLILSQNQASQASALRTLCWCYLKNIAILRYLWGLITVGCPMLLDLFVLWVSSIYYYFHD